MLLRLREKVRPRTARGRTRRARLPDLPCQEQDGRPIRADERDAAQAVPTNAYPVFRLYTAQRQGYGRAHNGRALSACDAETYGFAPAFQHHLRERQGCLHVQEPRPDDKGTRSSQHYGRGSVRALKRKCNRKMKEQ